MELGTWGDGTIRLAFWDSMHGDDRIFILNEDGTVGQHTYVYESEDDEEGREVVTPVDLVAKLRELATGWKEGAG